MNFKSRLLERKVKAIIALMCILLLLVSTAKTDFSAYAEAGQQGEESTDVTGDVAEADVQLEEGPAVEDSDEDEIEDSVSPAEENDDSDSGQQEEEYNGDSNPADSTNEIEAAEVTDSEQERENEPQTEAEDVVETEEEEEAPVEEKSDVKELETKQEGKTASTEPATKTKGSTTTANENAKSALTNEEKDEKGKKDSNATVKDTEDEPKPIDPAVMAADSAAVAIVPPAATITAAPVASIATILGTPAVSVLNAKTKALMRGRSAGSITIEATGGLGVTKPVADGEKVEVVVKIINRPDSTEFPYVRVYLFEGKYDGQEEYDAIKDFVSEKSLVPVISGDENEYELDVTVNSAGNLADDNSITVFLLADNGDDPSNKMGEKAELTLLKEKVDIKLPETPELIGPATIFVSKDSTADVTGKDDQGVAYFLYSTLEERPVSEANKVIDPAVGFKKADADESGKATLNVEKPDAEVIYYIWAVDVVGKVSQTCCSLTVKLDETKPVITMPAVEEWYKEAIPVEKVINATDEEGGSGIDKVIAKISKDGGDSTEREITVPCKLSALASEDGEYSITVVATDKAGNETTSDAIEFGIDQASPTITKPIVKEWFNSKDIEGDEYKNKAIVIKDETSKIESSEVTVIKDEGEKVAKDPSNNEEPLEYKLTALVDGDGAYEVAITATDNAGNSSEDTLSFGVDTTNPEITEALLTKINKGYVHGGGTFSENHLTLNLCTDDNKSGVKEVSIYSSNEEGTTAIETKPVDEEGKASFDLTGDDFGGKKDDIKALYVKVEDLAGNITDFISLTEMNAQVEIVAEDGNTAIVDVESDKLYIGAGQLEYNTLNLLDETYNNGETLYYGKNKLVKAEVEAKDEIVGIKEVKAKDNDTILAPEQPNPNTIEPEYKKIIDLGTTGGSGLSDGLHKLTVEVTNYAGISEEKAVSYYVDTVVPTISEVKVESGKKFKHGIYSSEALTFSIDATDPLFDNRDSKSASGIKTVEVVIYDNAGKEIKAVETTEKDSQYTATLTKDELGDESDIFKIRNVKIRATDNVGNTVEKTLEELLRTEPKSSNVYIGEAKPTVKVELNNTTYQDPKTRELFYGKDKEISISPAVTDKEAGVWTVDVKLTNVATGEEKKILTGTNGRVVDNTEKVATSFDDNVVLINTKDLPDGKYEVKVTAKNYAGQVVSNTIVFFVDKTAANVTKASTTSGNVYVHGTYSLAAISVKLEDVEDKANTSKYEDAKASGVKTVELMSIATSAQGTETVKTVDASFDEKAGEWKVDMSAANAMFDTGLDKGIKDAKVRIIDNVGNVKVVNMSDILTGKDAYGRNKKLTNNKVYIGEGNLVISEVIVNTQGKNATPEIHKIDDELWVGRGQDVKVNLNASDSVAGIRVGSLTLTGPDGKASTVAAGGFDFRPETIKTAVTVENKSGVVAANTDDLKDGKHTVLFKVTNNSGIDDSKEATFYVDTTAPTVELVAKGASKKIEGNAFGYFFKDKTTIIVNPTDGEGSGVAHVYYKLEGVSDNAATAKYIEVTPDGSGAYTFVVPANFKGRVYAYAVDRVGNGEKDSQPEKIKQLDKKAVIENQAQHNANSSIEIALPETSNATTQGTALYSANQTAKITIASTFAGIDLDKTIITVTYSGIRNSGTVSVKASDLNGLRRLATEDGDIVAKIEGTILVNRDCNDIKIGVKLVDNVGLSSTKDRKLAIDTIKPDIKIAYDNNSAQNEKYFKENRVATLTIRDRNFDKNATIDTKGSFGGWSQGSTDADGVTTWTGRVSYTTDGDYTISVSATDRAGHAYTAADSDYSGTATRAFTIDKTIPTITVTFNNNDVLNGKYYKNPRVATITINEHNFRASEAKVDRTASHQELSVGIPGVSGWGSSGDIQTATINYGTDGNYTITVNYTDLAGNPAQTVNISEFVVDTTPPTLEITGVENSMAYKGDVAPSIVYHDVNFDNRSRGIDIVGIKNPNAKELIGTAVEDAFGGSFTADNIQVNKESDDIYTIKGYVTDLAGNVTEATLVFSVNRFGSTYDYNDDQPTKSLVGSVSKDSRKFIIREVNISQLKEYHITLSINGESRTLKEGVDYTTKSSNPGWYEYVYEINENAFEKEGLYEIIVTSEDMAGNTNTNYAVKGNRGKVTALPASFTIDKTNPIALIEGVEDGKRYMARDRNILIRFEDNIGVSLVKIILNGEVIDVLDANDTADQEKLQMLHRGEYPYLAKADNGYQALTVEVYDAAGNKSGECTTRYLLTSNIFIQFINNIWAIIAALGLVGLLIFLLAKRRKKDEEEA